MEARGNIGCDIKAAGKAIIAGGVVAYPTEGVFGLGCDPTNESAIEKLLSLKQRSVDRGFILIAATQAQLNPFVDSLSAEIKTKLDASWPGAVTWILPASAAAPEVVTGSRNTIAARVTNHPTARELCIQCSSAVISTSANLSGEAACTTSEAVATLFGNQLDYILDFKVGDLQGPTPIFDGLTGKQLR